MGAKTTRCFHLQRPRPGGAGPPSRLYRSTPRFPSLDFVGYRRRARPDQVIRAKDLLLESIAILGHPGVLRLPSVDVPARRAPQG